MDCDIERFGNRRFEVNIFCRKHLFLAEFPVIQSLHEHHHQCDGIQSRNRSHHSVSYRGSGSRYRGDSELQQRIEELAELANEGELTTADQAEYEGYVQTNKFVAILQTQAKKLLSSSGSWWT